MQAILPDFPANMTYQGDFHDQSDSVFMMSQNMQPTSNDSAMVLMPVPSGRFRAFSTAWVLND